MALFSYEEFIVIAVALDDERKNGKRMWTHLGLINKKIEEEYYILYREIQQNLMFL